MKFNGYRFDRIWLTGHGDTPGRFTSCCVSREGNLSLVLPSINRLSGRICFDDQ